MAHITAGTKNVTLPFSVWNAGITGVTGSLTKGSTLTISGYDFGVGPAFSECFYDSCDRAGARSVNDPEVGQYSQTSLYYQTGGRDGGNCARMVEYASDGIQGLNRSTSKVALDNTKKLLVSFWFKQVANTYWTDSNVTGRDTFDGSASSFKFAWPQLGGAASINDIAILNHSGGAAGFALFSNSVTPNPLAYYDDAFWDFGEWFKCTAYLDADVPNASVDNCSAFVELIRPSAVGTKRWVYTQNFTMEAQDPPQPYVWDNFPLAAFLRNAPAAASVADDINMVIDDLYVAEGDSPASRIEIGDNADYALCTELINCYPATADWWKDDQIQVIVEQGSLNLAGDIWLFVKHSDNKRTMSWKVN